MKIIGRILSSLWLSLLLACIAAVIVLGIRVNRGLEHLNEWQDTAFYLYMLIVLIASGYQLFTRKKRIALRTLIYGFLFSLFVINHASMMVNVNVYRNTWRNSTAALPDGLGEVTISHRSFFGGRLSTTILPHGTEQMWKATLELPGRPPREFMIRQYIGEPEKITLSLISSGDRSFLRLRGIAPYADNSAYIDLTKLTLRWDAKGKERELGVWKRDEDGRLRFKQIAVD